MILSRRQFICAGCQVTAASVAPYLGQAKAAINGRVVFGSAFNGGLSQVNFGYIGLAGEYPFLNYVKTSAAWGYASGPNSGGQVSPQYNDVNGYPMLCPSSTSGYQSNFVIPPTTVRAGTYTIMWTGGDAGTVMKYFGTPVTYSITRATQAAQCVLAIGAHALAIGQIIHPQAVGGMTQLNGNNYQIVAISPTTITLNVNSSSFSPYTSGGVVTQTRGGANSQIVVQPNASPVPQGVGFGVTTISSGPPTNYVSGIAVVYTDDLPAYNAGEIFGEQFKAKLSQGGFGVYRFLNWQEGIPVFNMTTWATRKPPNYFTYADMEYRATLFGGTTNEGSFNGYDYELASPLALYAWPGWTSGAPIDKQTIQLYFDQDATFYSSTITLSGRTTFNWTSHGFVGGEAINFTVSGGYFPTNLSNSVTYYVLTAGLMTNSFQVGTMPGGLPVAFGSSASGIFSGTRLPTLNLNSGGKIPIIFYSGNGLLQANLPSVNSGGGQAALGTLVYDADLNAWLKAGGDSSGSLGLGNGCPFEIMLQLCKEMGAHPWFVAPFMAVDPMTDFHTQLATYIKNNMPTWMIPRFETCNELWNNSNNQTRYAFGKAFLQWNTQFAVGQFDSDDWQGKTASTIGQAINAAYGGSVGTRYQLIVGQKTSDFTSSGANGHAATLASTAYVGQSQSPQAGYTQSAAYHVSTHVCVANYFNPTQRGTSQETTDAAMFAGEAAIVVGGIASGVLTVTTVGSPGRSYSGVGTVASGQTITDQYGLIPSGVSITGQISGTTGGVGTYSIGDGSITLISGTLVICMSRTATALATAYADTCGGSAAYSGDGNGNLAQCKIFYVKCFAWAATYINDAGNTLGGCYYEGGYSPDLGEGNSNQVSFLRNMSKLSTDVGFLLTGGKLVNIDVVAGNYNDCVAAGGLFPSLFQLGGTNSIWSVLDPDVYASPTSAQWNAIANYH